MTELHQLGPVMQDEQMVLEPIDHEALRQMHPIMKGQRTKTGLVRSVPPFQSFSSAKWTQIEASAWVVRWSIVAPGATAMRVKLQNWNAAHQRILVSGSAFPEVAWEIDATRLAEDGVWSHVVWGDELIIELIMESSARPGPPSLTIDAVLDCFRDPFGRDVTKVVSGSSTRTLSCHLDTCRYYNDWAEEIDAVAAYAFVSANFGFSCTGTHLPPANGDDTSLFLTANHCLDTRSDARSIVVAWFYQSGPNCERAPSFPWQLPQSSGSDLLFTADFDSGNDGTLLLLTDAVPDNVGRSGWTSSSNFGNVGLTGIHHPDSDYKRISFGGFVQVASPQFPYHTVFWNPGGGTTEGGSSGSGVWTDSGQLIGQLFGGDADCTGGTDLYGTMSFTYTFASHWLDGDPAEPNNEAISASPIPLGISTGYTVTAWNEDWFSFGLGIGGSIRMTTEYEAGGGLGIEVYENGQVVQSSRAGTTYQFIEVVNNSSDFRNYTVRVFVISQRQSAYTLRVSLDQGLHPTPTPLPPQTGITLDGGNEFNSINQTLRVRRTIENGETYNIGVLTYVVADIGGQFYYLPNLTLQAESLDYVTLAPMTQLGPELIAEYFLPRVYAEIPIIWYGAIIEPGSGQLLGDISQFTMTLR